MWGVPPPELKGRPGAMRMAHSLSTEPHRNPCIGVPMNLKPLIAAVALSASVPAMAACYDLGTLGSAHPSTFFGNSFTQAQTISDCYVFALSSRVNAIGAMVDWNWTSSLGIELTSATLTGTNFTTAVSDLSAHHFSFSDLRTGDYQMVLAGNITGNGSADGPIGYAGVLAVSPVPEPESFAMLALGL